MKKKAIYLMILISLLIAIFCIIKLYSFQIYDSSLGKIDKVEVETKKSYSEDRYIIKNTETKIYKNQEYSSASIYGELTYEQFIVNESLVALDTNPIPFLKYIVEKDDDGEDERKAKLDATIEPWEVEELDEDTEVRYYPYGNLLEYKKWFYDRESFPSAYELNQELGLLNSVRATSRTIANYNRSTPKTLMSDEAWILAHARLLVSDGSVPKSETEDDGEVKDYSKARTDKVQQAMWKLKGYDSNDYEENFGTNNVGNRVEENLCQEAIWMRESTSKRDILSAPIMDNNSVEDYETLKAGIVSYNYGTKEFLVGPFSINYVRDAHEPIIGGLSEAISADQGGGNLILYSGIVGANVYAIVNNQEQLLTDWEFVYNNVVMEDGILKRAALASEGEFGDEDDNIYPYPNEEFYIKFLNPNNSIQAITKLEFELQTLNAEGSAKELKGTYSNINWEVGRTLIESKGPTNEEDYVPPTTDQNGDPVSGYWKNPPRYDYKYSFFIKDKETSRASAAKLYQIKSAKIYQKIETIQLKVGAKHSGYNICSDYCIPLTMEIAGTVWIDGAESTRRRKRYKRKWRIWKRQCKSTFI